MSAEDYITGIGSEEWLTDPSDFMPDSCYMGGSAPAKSYTNAARFSSKRQTITPEDCAGYKSKLGVIVIADAQHIHSTAKAELYSSKAGQFWVAKANIVSRNPLTVPTWVILNTFKEGQGTFTGLCPYCGSQGCSCGQDITEE